MTKPKHSPAPAPAEAPAAPVAPATAAAVVAPVVQSSFKFKIDDGVPFPSKRVGPKGETAYPYAALNVGQSFFVPSTDKMKEPWKTLTSMSSRISREMHPKQFTTARDTVEGVTGVRIWRKADTDKALAPPKVINRKPRGEAARLAAEAAAGDTSQRVHPVPDFEGGNPPPPPPPAA